MIRESFAVDGKNGIGFCLDTTPPVTGSTWYFQLFSIATFFSMIVHVSCCVWCQFRCFPSLKDVYTLHLRKMEFGSGEGKPASIKHDQTKSKKQAQANGCNYNVICTLSTMYTHIRHQCHKSRRKVEFCGCSIS